MSVEARLAELGLTLPRPAAPVANYVPFVVSGDMVSVSGQIPMGASGIEFQGKVGVDYSVDEAKDAARLCGLNIIAQLHAATGGNLDRITRIVKLGGFVNCTDDFIDQPQVINAASDLMVDAFGEAGRHSRSAVGVNALPLGVPVEIDCLAEIAPD